MNQYPEYNENIKSVICKNIKKFRNEKNVSLMDLAEKLDVSVEHLKRMEATHDRNNISLITLYTNRGKDTKKMDKIKVHF